MCDNLTAVLLVVGGNVCLIFLELCCCLLEVTLKVFDFLRAELLLVGGDVKMFDILRAVVLLVGGDVESV